MVDGESIFKPYCPRCRSDAHTEVQCSADVVCGAKRKSSDTEDSKPGESGKHDFKKFKADLAQIVLKGKVIQEFQYIREREDYDELCAYYKVFYFGALSGTLATSSEHAMARNEQVMDLWAKFTREGMGSDDAKEHLMMACQHD